MIIYQTYLKIIYHLIFEKLFELLKTLVETSQLLCKSHNETSELINFTTNHFSAIYRGFEAPETGFRTPG